MSKQSFGARLRAARRAAGLTQAQAAAVLGVTQPRIARWESGGRTPPSGLLKPRTQEEILLAVEAAGEGKR